MYLFGNGMCVPVLPGGAGVTVFFVLTGLGVGGFCEAAETEVAAALGSDVDILLDQRREVAEIVGGMAEDGKLGGVRSDRWCGPVGRLQSYDKIAQQC